MHVMHRPSWQLPETAATAERLFVTRRGFLGAGVAAAAALVPDVALGQRAADVPDPTSDLYPMQRNDKYQLDRPITDEMINGSYNNFFEFGSSKLVAKPAQALKVRPWTVKIDGMVERPREVGVDDLIRQMPREERLYRHRCVEAWAMAIPWSGFPFAAFVKFASPLASATYVRMETFVDAKIASGQRQSYLPWPYVEGLTMAEATNELAFLAVGAYGKPMPKVHGAPLRLAVPWKYGFKSIKSIVRFTFTDQRPKSFWEALAPSEYGFWANVNPKVPHPRWSQETEELIGLKERRPTVAFNGYGEYVAGLYKDLEGERLYV
jgi:sulfoxide reductase catalytic subunit YedY